MVIIPIKEEFDKMLLKSGTLVNLLEERRYTFIGEARTFIGEVERLAEKYQLPFAVEAGILRGRLCVIDEMSGGERKGGYNPENRRIYRRNRDAYALKQLDETCHLVRNYFSQAEATFQETLNLCRQMAAIAQAKALLPAALDEQNRDVQIRHLLEKLRKDPDLAGLCTHITGLAGLHNSVILFDRALSDLGV
jgi:hypothetical protein